MSNDAKLGEPFRKSKQLRSDPFVRLLGVLVLFDAAVWVLAQLFGLFEFGGPAGLANDIAVTGFTLIVGGGLFVVVVVGLVSPTTKQLDHWSQLVREQQRLEGVTDAPNDRLAAAKAAVTAGKRAVYRRDYATALENRYAAERQRFLIENDGTDGASLAELQTRLDRVGSKQLPEGRRQTLKQHLSADNSTMGTYYAIETLHEWNVQQLQRLDSVRRYFRLAILGCVIVLGGVVGLALFGNGTYFAGDLSPTPVEIVAGGLLFGLAGTLTSIVYSGARELRSRTTEPTVPRADFVIEGLVTRALVGAVFGVLIVVIAQTTIAEAIIAVDISTNIVNLLFVAFVAGFSDRVFKRRIESFADGAFQSDSDPLSANEQSPDSTFPDQADATTPPAGPEADDSTAGGAGGPSANGDSSTADDAPVNSTGGDDGTEPSAGDDGTEPSADDDGTEPSADDDTADPSAEDKSPPTADDDAAEPSVDE